MENNFDHNEFEHFVKENADQYRMFPSEKVWKGIHKNIHTRRRWFGFGLSFLILTTGVVTWVMLGTSGKNTPVITSLHQVIAQPTPKEISSPAKIFLAPTKPNDNNLGFVTQNPQNNLFIYDDYVAPHAILTNEEPVSEYASTAAPIFEKTAVPVSDQLNAQPLSVPQQAAITKIVSAPVPQEKTITTLTNISITESKDKDIEAIREEITRAHVNDYPFTIESVVNSYQYSRRNRKTSFEVYVTPSISYRELKENKPFIEWARSQTSGFANGSTYAANVNNVVKHKPDMGLQVGVSAALPAGKKVRFTAGLQFNVSKYDIRAYTHPTELATISLSNISGGRNTVTAPSDYRNTGSSTENWLRNLYISASVPVGLEVKLLGNRRNYFGLGATIQPTYIISNKSYLLSTDYKNYAKIPSLTRNLNMNAGMEMFAGISTGKLKWRVGPQVRYQVMSSYVERYPIKEHLFDFGLKMGIMLNH